MRRTSHHHHRLYAALILGLTLVVLLALAPKAHADDLVGYAPHCVDAIQDPVTFTFTLSSPGPPAETRRGSRSRRVPAAGRCWPRRAPPSSLRTATP